jgi:hypothetical protein
MISPIKLRARQEAMFQKHHPKPRPYDQYRRDRDEDSWLRLDKMFELGATDELIAEAFRLRVQAVRFLRDVRHRKGQ